MPPSMTRSISPSLAASTAAALRPFRFEPGPPGPRANGLRGRAARSDGRHGHARGGDTLHTRPRRPLAEQLLDILVTSCRIEKAFLFDVVAKIYVATDSSPVDMQSYELCADMIDVVIDVSCIYGKPRAAAARLTAMRRRA